MFCVSFTNFLFFLQIDFLQLRFVLKKFYGQSLSIKFKNKIKITKKEFIFFVGKKCLNCLKLFFLKLFKRYQI